MEKYVTRIENFWKSDLDSHVYASQTPFRGMRNDWHDNYHSDGFILQTFNDDLPIDPKKFYQALLTDEGSVAWTCLVPNTILPPHYDKFYLLSRDKGYPRENCVRYLVFLEDCNFGQLVVLGSTVISTWSAGDVWVFDSSTLHYAVNASNANFHSCQVSTLNNETSTQR